MRYLVVFIFVSTLFMIGCGKGKVELKSYGDPVNIADLNPPKRDYWPTQGWKTASPESKGMDSEKLKEMEKYAFTIDGTEEDRQGTRTDGVVIIRGGYLVYENYARGYEKDSKHLIWSIAKSYINTLVGVAIQNNKINLDDPAYNIVPELSKTPEHKKITIRHLLTMTSGLAANEGYESNPLNSTVIAMLYTMGRKNMGTYSAELPMRAEPGTFVYYSSCDTNILSLALKNVYGDEYENLPWKELFNPLGIKNITFEHDASKTYVGSSYIYTTPRDLAKFGYLYLNNGKWENKTLLSKDWINFTRTPSIGYGKTPYYDGLEENVYTAQWYANTGVPDAGIPKPIPDAPSDTFYGSGHWGQRIFVIPSLDMVVVRLGDDRNTKYWDNNQFLKYIVESVKK
ncbi:MAG: serine hydrolase [Leptospira sp.]|nr:serine hydrolase [Leptospira sp.]